MQGFKTHVPVDIEELESTYRILPLAIGCIIPLSILINVPSLTSPWVGTSDLIAATLQDVLSIGAVVPFCLKYPHSEGFVYLEGFWTMVASMIFSLSATVMMSIDIYRTPHFRLHGSGVTHKQRILIAEAMSLCFYLAIGALVFIWLEKWSFVESLFFVMVTITTIGFGNTVPRTSAGQTFVIFYAAGGIVLFAMAVNAIRYVILEDLHRQFALRAKERKAKKDARRRQRREERIREKERRKRVQETLQQLALIDGSSIMDPNQNSRSHHFTILQKHFTLPGTAKRVSGLFFSHGAGGHNNSISSGNNNNNAADETSESMSGEFSDSTLANSSGTGAHRKKDHLLIEMLQQQPLEAGDRSPSSHGNSARELGEETDREQVQSGPPGKAKECAESFSSRRRFRSLFHLVFGVTRYCYRAAGHACGWRGAECCSRIADVQPTAKEQREADKKLAHEESMEEYRRRLRFSFLMFLSFWLIGAAVFHSIEGWTFGQAMYFSFVAFSTIGYGDLVPLTLAGRSLFLAYCLVGIVTLTFLAALVSELLSKTMRRHVVQTQLRRSERFIEHGDKLDPQSNDPDLEQGQGDGGDPDGLNDASSDDGLQEERMRTLQNLISPAATEEQGDGSQKRTCQGSLRNLVQVSRDFDTLLQKVLGPDYGGEVSTSDASGTSPAIAVESSSESILDYLEKGDDDDSSYLSPSISRDVTSTSSIHRHSKLTGRSSLDLRSTGTYHGTGHSTTPSSQFSITAWPTAAAAAISKTAPTKPASQHRPHDHLHRPSQDGASSITATATVAQAHRHNADGTVTITAVHWQHLIEYSKQFRILTDSCDQTLQRLLAWEANEKRMCLKRRQIKERQQRLLRERRLRLFELGGTYGAVDDGIEDEEELEEWEEEGSSHEDEFEDEDEENGGRGIYNADVHATAENGGSLGDDALDKTREGIADVLLGTERPQLSLRSVSQRLVKSPSPEILLGTQVGRSAIPSTLTGVVQPGARALVSSRGRSFHPPASHDMSADESSTTAVSVTGGLSPTLSREARQALQARELGAAARRRSRSRTRAQHHQQQLHHQLHNQHGGSGSGNGSNHAGPQRPPLHTIHTNIVLPSGSEDTQEDDA
ncbi:hypothetical protein BGZ83_003214 [Gryganskiella cystojenkinii]|nr:hypothetical protein BGZ83_003214 [Gryganskiella cystojenkinii]